LANAIRGRGTCERTATRLTRWRFMASMRRFAADSFQKGNGPARSEKGSWSGRRPAASGPNGERRAFHYYRRCCAEAGFFEFNVRHGNELSCCARLTMTRPKSVRERTQRARTSADVRRPPPRRAAIRFRGRPVLRGVCAISGRALHSACARSGRSEDAKIRVRRRFCVYERSACL
jgi:hypothetical protein